MIRTAAILAALAAATALALAAREAALARAAGEPEPDEQITRTDHALALAATLAAAPAMHPDLVFLSPDGES